MPLTISAQKGLINQYDYFDKQIASLNLSNYYIIQNGEFAYNKSYSNGYPYGAIKRLDYFEQGALSSLYICFSISNIDSDYLVKYFDSGKWNKQVKLISGEGARNHGLLNLSPDDFFNINIMISPSEEEQTKIAHFLNLINSKIKYMDGKIEALKKYRKGIIHHLIKKGSLASKIRDLVRVEKKTGLASSYGKDIGSYPFFINNDEGIEKYCDEYIFNGQYLIINTGGTASVKYYDGKFSAMSDCLILRPIAHAIGLYYFLVANEKRINIAGFQGTGLKHLDQKWFFNLKVILPNLSDAELNKLNELTESQIENLKKKAQLMKSFKQYLLANMFI